METAVSFGGTLPYTETEVPGQDVMLTKKHAHKKCCNIPLKVNSNAAFAFPDIATVLVPSVVSETPAEKTRRTDCSLFLDLADDTRRLHNRSWGSYRRLRRPA